MVERIVFDTDVISYIFKRDTRAESCKPYIDNKQIVISFATVAELEFWAIKNNWGEHRISAMEQHLRSFVIYPVDRKLCKKWAELSVSLQRKGKYLAPHDGWIAATALIEDIPLVTNNRKDFEFIEGLKLLPESVVL